MSGHAASKEASPFSSMGDMTVDRKEVSKLLDGLNVAFTKSRDGMEWDGTEGNENGTLRNRALGLK